MVVVECPDCHKRAIYHTADKCIECTHLECKMKRWKFHRFELKNLKILDNNVIVDLKLQ